MVVNKFADVLRVTTTTTYDWSPWREIRRLIVVYFDQLSGAARTRKPVKLLFFSRFQPFLFVLNLFQWFHASNQQITSENEQKTCFFSYFSYSLKLVDMQKLVDSLRAEVPWNHVFSVDFFTFLNVFQQFLTDFSLFSLIFNFFEWNWGFLFSIFQPLKRLIKTKTNQK